MLAALMGGLREWISRHIWDRMTTHLHETYPRPSPSNNPSLRRMDCMAPVLRFGKGTGPSWSTRSLNIMKSIFFSRNPAVTTTGRIPRQSETITILSRAHDQRFRSSAHHDILHLAPRLLPECLPVASNSTSTAELRVHVENSCWSFMVPSFSCHIVFTGDGRAPGQPHAS